MAITSHPVATVKNSRQDESDDFWGDIISEIELVENAITENELNAAENTVE